jgi:carbonic anhydrase/acetyltransferase-like protein (isoleucine patch superfamily)
MFVTTIKLFLLYIVNRHRRVMNFKLVRPEIGKNVFIAPNASVIGRVKLGDNSSVWYSAILRGFFILKSIY